MSHPSFNIHRSLLNVFLIPVYTFLSADAAAQRGTKDSAFVADMQGLPASQLFRPDQGKRQRDTGLIYVISHDDVYELFGYMRAQSLSAFDFSHYHILGLREAGTWKWKIRENSKAFSLVPVKLLDGHPPEIKHLWGDSVQRFAGDTLKWFVTAGGDCFARFRYELLGDNYYSAFLLKEWNYWGGCRAARFRDFTIQFHHSGALRHYSTHTILADRWKTEQ
ncbi:MAG TPA: hypothetical protein VEB63_09805 [Chitinophagaceae bacterium]|nr:hypothetical protein [Chitinophagaceae bacterium]